jgi:hypothetical protein
MHTQRRAATSSSPTKRSTGKPHAATPSAPPNSSAQVARPPSASSRHAMGPLAPLRGLANLVSKPFRRGRGGAARATTVRRAGGRRGAVWNGWRGRAADLTPRSKS